MRAEMLEQVWHNTPRDRRGIIGGERYISVHRRGEGTCLIPLTALHDNEITRRIPSDLQVWWEYQLAKVK
jgi:hypothetical protein